MNKMITKIIKNMGVMLLAFAVGSTSLNLTAFAADEEMENIQAIVEAVNNLDKGNTVEFKLEDTDFKMKKSVNRKGNNVVRVTSDHGDDIICTYDTKKQQIDFVRGVPRVFEDEIEVNSYNALEKETVSAVKAGSKRTKDSFFKAYSYYYNTKGSTKYYNLSNGSKKKYPVKYSGKNKTYVNKFKKGVTQISNNGKQLKKMFKGEQLLLNTSTLINYFACLAGSGEVTLAAALAGLSAGLGALGVCGKYVIYVYNIFYGEVSCESALRKAKIGL